MNPFYCIGVVILIALIIVGLVGFIVDRDFYWVLSTFILGLFIGVIFFGAGVLTQQEAENTDAKIQVLEEKRIVIQGLSEKEILDNATVKRILTLVDEYNTYLKETIEYASAYASDKLTAYENFYYLEYIISENMIIETYPATLKY